MKKSIFRIFSIAACVLLMLYVPIMNVLAADGDEVRATKKVISVVYDDSGSMTDAEKWSYANYAMQALIALLNEQDDLYITFMSSPGTAVKIDTSDLNKSIKKIHDWKDTDGTPIEALDTAKAKLDEINTDDISVQYWLVVMTDGQFGMFSSIEDKIGSYKNNTMSNSTLLNTVYLAIGDDAVKVNGDENNRIYSYSSKDNDEIVSTLSSIANRVSGRLNADNVTQKDSKTIVVKSSLPLYSLSILSQGSNAEAKEAKTSEEDLIIQRNIALDATDLELGKPIDNLYGNAAVITMNDDAGDLKPIPADTYTITFSNDVDIDRMNIQFEPAIGLKAEVSKDGDVVDDMSQLGKDDKVDVRVIPVVVGTDEEISRDDLPEGISLKTEYEVDGKTISSVDGDELKDVKLIKGKNVIKGVINIPGYAPQICEIPFNIDKVIYNFGITVSQPKDLSYGRSHLKDIDFNDKNAVKFTITNNGNPLSKEELDSTGVTLTIKDTSCEVIDEYDKFPHNMAKKKIECVLKQNEDGSYYLFPDYIVGFPVAGLKVGTYSATVSLNFDNTVTAKGQFDVYPEAEDVSNLMISLIIILVIIYLLWVIIFKKKFKGQVVHYECWEINDDGSGILKRSSRSEEQLGIFSGGLLLPTKVCSREFHGLKLCAAPNKGVFVTGKSIAKTVAKYGTSTMDPEYGLGTISEMLTCVEKANGARTAADHRLSRSYMYFQSSLESRTVWRIWMT